MLRQDSDHSGIFGKRVLFQDPISLQTQLDIPESPKSISNCKFRLISLTMTLWETPELYERCHELDLVSLSAYMSQTDHKVILQQTLNDNICVDSGEVKINSESIYHLQTVIFNKIFQYLIELSFRDVLDSSVLDELFKNSVKNSLWFFESSVCLIRSETRYYFVLGNLKKKVKLVGFDQKLQRNDYHLQVVILLQ